MGLEFRVINSFKLPFPFFLFSSSPLPPDFHVIPLCTCFLRLDPRRGGFASVTSPKRAIPPRQPNLGTDCDSSGDVHKKQNVIIIVSRLRWGVDASHCRRSLKRR